MRDPQHGPNLPLHITLYLSGGYILRQPEPGGPFLLESQNGTAFSSLKHALDALDAALLAIEDYTANISFFDAVAETRTRLRSFRHSPLLPAKVASTVVAQVRRPLLSFKSLVLSAKGTLSPLATIESVTLWLRCSNSLYHLEAAHHHFEALAKSVARARGVADRFNEVSDLSRTGQATCGFEDIKDAFYSVDAFLGSVFSAQEAVARVVAKALPTLGLKDNTISIPNVRGALHKTHQAPQLLRLLDGAWDRWMKKARVYRNCVVHHTPLDLSPVMSAVALPQGDYPCRLELRLPSNPEARDPTKFDSHGPSGVDGVLYCRDLLLNAAELTDQLAAWVLNHRESPQRGAPP